MWFSVSLAVTAAPTFVPAAEFSAMLRVAVVSGKSACTFLSCVLVVPLSDHAPSPSSLTARTCTS